MKRKKGNKADNQLVRGEFSCT